MSSKVPKPRDRAAGMKLMAAGIAEAHVPAWLSLDVPCHSTGETRNHESGTSWTCSARRSAGRLDPLLRRPPSVVTLE